MMSSSPIESVKSEIENNKVVVYSKSWCGYSMRTKMLFEDMGVDTRVIELDEDPDGAEIQEALEDMTGQRTVPNTFINGKHVGGNDDVQALAFSGELEKMLK